MSETSPPEERSRRRTRLWDLEGWSLRWKVTAVLAVPVTVAMVLGGLRVQGELSNAVHFTSAAEQISGIPDIVSLEGAMGALVGGHASNTATPEDRELVETQLDRVSDFADTPDLDSNTADAIRKSVAEGRALVDLMDAPGTTIDTLADRQRAFAEGLLTEFDQVVSTVDDPEVVDKGAMLANAWQAQRRLFEETVGLIAILNDPTTPITNVVGATGGEAALLEVLGRYYDERSMEDRSQLDALRAGIDERARLTAQGVEAIESGTGGLPILQLRTSLLQSKDTYTSLVSDAALDIAATVQNRADETRSAALRDTAIVVGTVLAALVLALLVSRSLVGPIRRLRYGALKAARRDLPDAIEQIKSSDDPRAISFDPVEVYTDEEIGQLARAVDDIHAQALKLAGEQAHLRLQINDMFETLARRSKSLVDQQLTLIESLEFEEKDPRRLESLFRLDHLAARMRRNGENLLVLAGTRSRRAQTDSIALGDILRAAISEVEDYQRVQMGATPEGLLSGAVATDVVHMLAELVDNALRASPPDTSVTFSFARAVDGGVLLEIADRGIGIPADQMFGINERLASGGEIGPETARHMGLFVVSRLAQRHGLTVRMRSTFDTARNPGVTVSIHIPTSLIVSPAERGTGHTGPQRAVQGRQQQAVAAPSRPALPQRRDGGRDAGAPPAPGLPPLPRRGEPAPAASAESAPAAPPREPGANPPLPRRGESGLPQRGGVDGDAGAPPIPRRDTGLPQREPGLSQRDSGLPQRDSGLPQRESGLPQREPTRDRDQHEPQEAPAAEVSSTGLPKRRPGASGISSYMPSKAPAAPAEPAPSDPLTDEWVLPESADTPARPPEQKEPRHRYRSNAAKTASFFQSRTEVPPVDGSADPTPIFADMMSNWLTDPTASDTTMGEWHSAGDETWAAVDRVIAKPVEVDPEIGLPKRRPGERLLPGAVDDASDTGTFRKVRDPDAIRAKLSRHQQGVRNGRAGRSFGANQADRDHAPAGTGSAPAGSSTYSTGSHSTEGER